MIEQTLLLIKPDAVAAGNVGRIITTIEDNDFSILAARVFRFDQKLSEVFYRDHLGKDFYPRLEAFMCSGLTWALVLQKDNAVHELRELLGDVIPEQRKAGSIRAMYGHGITDNGAHGSDSVQSAEREIGVIFGPVSGACSE